MISKRATIFALNTFIQKYFTEDFRFIFFRKNSFNGMTFTPLAFLEKSRYVFRTLSNICEGAFWEHR